MLGHGPRLDGRPVASSATPRVAGSGLQRLLGCRPGRILKRCVLSDRMWLAICRANRTLCFMPFTLEARCVSGVKSAVLDVKAS